MAAAISTVKAAIGTALSSISGLRTFSYQPDQVNPPMAWPILDSVEYHDAMAGSMVQKYRIGVIVGRQTDRIAQRTMDAYLAPSGIPAALEADPTLGQTVQASVCESATDISNIDAGDTTYLYVEFRFTVYA